MAEGEWNEENIFTNNGIIHLLLHLWKSVYLFNRVVFWSQLQTELI